MNTNEPVDEQISKIKDKSIKDIDDRLKVTFDGLYYKTESYLEKFILDLKFALDRKLE